MHDPSSETVGPTDLHSGVRDVVLRKGHRQFNEPVKLASGLLSRDFIDGKRALAHGDDLSRACRAMMAIAQARGIEFDTVGGMTLGADHFSHGIALLAGCEWFTVRKVPKGRGTNQRIEGRLLGAGDRVLLVDDVVTTGGSIKEAYEQITEAGGVVVLATALVDRGDYGRAYFDGIGVPYQPVLTYDDLGIEAVGDGSRVASTAG